MQLLLLVALLLVLWCCVHAYIFNFVGLGHAISSIPKPRFLMSPNLGPAMHNGKSRNGCEHMVRAMNLLSIACHRTFCTRVSSFHRYIFTSILTWYIIISSL